MAAGRPLSMPTIVKRLRHLRDGAYFDHAHEAQLLDSMSDMLASNHNLPAKALHAMVGDLQALHDSSSLEIDLSSLRMLSSVIDGLARIETSRFSVPHTKLATVKAKRTPKLADFDDVARSAAAASLQAAEQALVSTGRTALARAIIVLLDQVVDGNSDSDTISLIHDLVDALDRLS